MSQTSFTEQDVRTILDHLNRVKDSLRSPFMTSEILAMCLPLGNITKLVRSYKHKGYIHRSLMASTFIWALYPSPVELPVTARLCSIALEKTEWEPDLNQLLEMIDHSRQELTENPDIHFYHLHHLEAALLGLLLALLSESNYPQGDYIYLDNTRMRHRIVNGVIKAKEE